MQDHRIPLSYATPPDPRSLRPVAVTVVAWVLIAFGVLGLMNMFWKLAHGTWFIESGVLGVFMGSGLLRGRSGWWKVTLVYFAAGIVFVLASVPLVLGKPWAPMRLNLFGMDAATMGKTTALLLLTLMFAAAFIGIFALTRPHVRVWFKLRQIQRGY